MNCDEHIYKRLSLNVNCRSSEIAYSYLEGRVDNDEKFECAGEILSFQQILIKDEIVRAVIVQNADLQEILKRTSNSLDNFTARYELFKKIVLRGDDSLTTLLLQLDDQKQRIQDQETQIIKLQNNIEFCNLQHDILVRICISTLSALKDFSVILNGFRDNFVKIDSDTSCTYDSLLQMEQSAICSIEAALQENYVAIPVQINDSLPEKIKKVDLIDNLQKENEQNIINRKKELEEYIQKKHNELAEREKKHLEYVTRETQKIQQAKQDSQKQLEDLKQQIEKEIDEKNHQLLHNICIAGDFYSTVKKLSSDKFIPNRCVYSGENISPQVLLTAILKCNSEIAPGHVIAIYDDSYQKKGTAGILVTYHAFYVYGNFSTKKYLLHHNNTLQINIKPRSKAFYFGLVGIIPAIILFIYNLLFPGIALAVISLVFICASCRSYKKIMYRNAEVATFSGRTPDKFKTFVNDLNDLASSCHWSSETKQKIQKINM